MLSRLMITKALIVFTLFAILISLGSAMVYMVKDKGQSDRTVKALSVRIGLSMALFILMMLGIAAGLITPHGVYH
jgi:4-hydroxybenzoate polyprenyltransferase